MAGQRHRVLFSRVTMPSHVRWLDEGSPKDVSLPCGRHTAAASRSPSRQWGRCVARRGGRGHCGAIPHASVPTVGQAFRVGTRPWDECAENPGMRQPDLRQPTGVSMRYDITLRGNAMYRRAFIASLGLTSLAPFAAPAAEPVPVVASFSILADMV